MTSIAQRIKSFNRIARFPVIEGRLVNWGWKKVVDFLDIFEEEVAEGESEVIGLWANRGEPASIDDLVRLADWLGDMIVYIRSEALKWGIPIDDVVHIIMDSQDSKLVHGSPLYDDRGKLLKGPYYEPPEPRIKALLEQLPFTSEEFSYPHPQSNGKEESL